jgi:hypothetical protein
MTLIDERERKPKAFVLIRQACKNRLKKGAQKGLPGYLVTTEHVIRPE